MPLKMFQPAILTADLPESGLREPTPADRPSVRVLSRSPG